MDLNFENEKALITEYLNILQIIKEQEMVKNLFPVNITSVDETKLKTAYEQKTLICRKLHSLEIKPVTNLKVKSLLNQVKAIISALKESSEGENISRTQDLIFENAIYLSVRNDIEGAFHSYELNYFIPNYQYSRDSTFDYRKLKNYLIEFSQSLIKNHPTNYLELQDRVFQCFDIIEDLAEQGCTANIS